MPTPAINVFAAIVVILILASGIGSWLKRRYNSSPVIENLNARIRSWWWMILVSIAVMSVGQHAIFGFFLALSILTLFEFAPSARWYDAGAIAVHYFGGSLLPWLPVYALFRDRDTRWGIILCGYALSFAYAPGDPLPILFFMLIVQSSDILRYVWGKLAGRRKIAPVLSPSKTVEGLIGGAVSATLLGAGLGPLLLGQGRVAAGAISLAVVLAAFLSGLLFSAVKRRRGMKDWSAWIPGHGGFLDRIDSVILSAPLFYWLCRIQ